MKIQLLISTLAVGFLAGLGIAAVRGDLSHLAAAPVQDFPGQVAMAPPPIVAVRPVPPAPLNSAIALPAHTVSPQSPPPRSVP